MGGVKHGYNLDDSQQTKITRDFAIVAEHASQGSWIMPARGLMHRKLKLFAAFSTLLLSMCTFYDQSGAIVSPNGLSCQNRTDYGLFQSERAAECYYKCPDGTVRQPEIKGEFSVSSPLYSAPQAEMDGQYCQGAMLTSTPRPTSEVPTDLPVDATATPAFSTEQALPSPSATSLITVPNQPPLLRGDVTMCDVAVNLISFRMLEPVPDLTAAALEVQIADQPSFCTVNPTNTSLLTCTIPPGVVFPARVFVRLDGATVNDFIYDGLGCAKIATQFPTTTP